MTTGEQEPSPPARPPLPPLTPADRERWLSRWDTEQARALGVRAIDVQRSYAHFVVEQPYGDERDNDPSHFMAGLLYAADIAAVAAANSGVDTTRQQGNGTASLHMNFLSPPRSPVDVEARVTHWGEFQALAEMTARDRSGAMIAHGLSAYSLRPKGDRPATSNEGATEPPRGAAQ
ncbi:MAG: hypothetical protein DWI59_01190 [Chloroflexi bacterium]|nr:MAG: hypothetical protein DWI59_01190 [Chloroflexota bacterium]